MRPLGRRANWTALPSSVTARVRPVGFGTAPRRASTKTANTQMFELPAPRQNKPAACPFLFCVFFYARLTWGKVIFLDFLQRPAAPVSKKRTGTRREGNSVADKRQLRHILECLAWWDLQDVEAHVSGLINPLHARSLLTFPARVFVHFSTQIPCI